MYRSHAAMYETRVQEPLSPRRFFRRLSLHAGLAFAIFLPSLAAGMAGYIYFEHLPWRDAFLNAAMLLGGMGPVDAPKTAGGKLFAGCYALYAGVFFLASAAIVIAPVVHRVLHTFHGESSRSPGS